MIYASVCSGIEAATVAWHPLGWKPVWFSQYDPENDYTKKLDFPSEALKHYYPSVPNLGDMTNIRDTKIYHDTKFDVLVGGTPCQSFSIAGLRKGLGDERGNLSLEYARILYEKLPTWFVWENVPGVLTSGSEAGNEGEGESPEEFDGDPRDFACLLSAWTGRDIAPQDFEKGGIIEGATEENYSVAWRILDSQYFGVPQRRRRIFVIGHLGKDWRPPFAVLFEQESLRRDFTPRREKREGAPENTKGSPGGDSERVGQQSRPAELASCLNAHFSDKMGLENQHINQGAPLFVPHTIDGNGLPDDRMTAFGEYTADETASTLKKRDHKDATDLVIMPPRSTAETIDCRNDVINEEISGTLQAKANGGQSLNFVNPVFIVETGGAQPPAPSLQGNMIGRSDEAGPQGSGISEETSFTLTKGDRHGVVHTVYDTTQITSPQNGSNPKPGDPAPPLVKNGHVPVIVSVSQNQVGDVITGEVMHTLNKNGNATGRNAPVVLIESEHGHEPIVMQDNAHAFKEREGKEGGGKGYLGSDELAFTRSRVQDQKIHYKTLIRRLTPLECCRLQGFPDGYLSDVPGATDSKMYAAFGNSMTTFVMRWIGKRIQLVQDVIDEVKAKKG